MVKIKAPMMSLDAAGSLGNAIVFSTWKGQPYVRANVSPKNPKSAAQTGIRAMLSFLSPEWKNLTAEQQATWAELAAAKNQSPINAYIAYNVQRWRTFKGPTKAYPPALTADDRSGDMNCLPGPRHVRVHVVANAGPNEWGLIVLRDTAEITVPTWSQVIAVLKGYGPATWSTHYDYPLAIGTYHYVFYPFNDCGRLGSMSDDVPINVTE